MYFKKPVIKLCHLTELELLSIGYDWKQFTESLPPAINAKKYGHWEGVREIGMKSWYVSWNTLVVV